MDERRIQTSVLIKAYLKTLMSENENRMGEYINNLIEEDMKKRGLLK